MSEAAFAEAAAALLQWPVEASAETGEIRAIFPHFALLMRATGNTVHLGT